MYLHYTSYKKKTIQLKKKYNQNGKIDRTLKI